MAYRDIILDKAEGIATLTFNRPDKLNALSLATMEEVISALEEVAADDEVRVLILTGAGRAFSSGADLSADIPKEMEQRLRLEPFSGFGRAAMLLRNLEKPTIAAVNGIAAGGGFSLAMGCDLRIASEAARFSCIFVRRALVPDTGATFYLPRLVGTARALEMMYTGEFVDAREAERIGLVNQVVPGEELMTATLELARRIAKMSPIILGLTKRAVMKAMDTNDLAIPLAYEAWAQSIAFQTEDFQEGVKAFFEKREPVFKGR